MRKPIVLLFAVLAAALPAQNPSALIGTWKLNLSKSTYEAGPPSYKKTTCRIEPWDDGLKVTYDIVGTRGGISHLEWIGKLDGRDYPMQGIDEVITNAYTRIDDRTYDIVVKADGAKAAAARTVIAPDGKTLTTVTTVRDGQGRTVHTTTVYEKQ